MADDQLLHTPPPLPAPLVAFNGQTPPVLLPAASGTQALVRFGSSAGKVGVRAVNACAAGTEIGKDVSVGFNLAPLCPNGLMSAADNCADLCVYCDFTTYSGNNGGYAADSPPPAFCGIIENNLWLGFVAGSAATTLTLTSSDCMLGNGLQMALYNQCAATPDSATRCMDSVRSWNSMFTPAGPTSVVCKDW